VKEENHETESDPAKHEGKSDSSATEISKQPQPAEIGGRKGPEPVRYGDWEKNGRCIDF
jgi:hypothetical protein